MVILEAPESRLNCFGKCCKWSLYLFNLLILLSGIAAVSAGIWVSVDPTSLRIVVLTYSHMYIYGSFMLIGAGGAAIFVSIIGCFGARYENRCLLIMFVVALLLTCIIEFSGGVLAMAFYTQAATLANTEMRNAIILKYGQGNHHEATDAYNYVQQMFDCCGFEGTDIEAAQLYQISLWFESNLIIVPASCCTRNEQGEPINQGYCQSRFNTHLSYINNRGCQPAVVKQGRYFAMIIAVAGVGAALVQLVGMIMGFCIARQL